MNDPRIGLLEKPIRRLQVEVHCLKLRAQWQMIPACCIAFYSRKLSEICN